MFSKQYGILIMPIYPFYYSVNPGTHSFRSERCSVKGSNSNTRLLALFILLVCKTDITYIRTLGHGLNNVHFWILGNKNMHKDGKEWMVEVGGQEFIRGVKISACNYMSNLSAHPAIILRSSAFHQKIHLKSSGDYELMHEKKLEMDECLKLQFW